MATSLPVFSGESQTSQISDALLEQGGVIIERLVSEELMDRIYEEIQSAVAPEAQEGSSELWPEGTKTVGGLASVSRTFVEQLLIHPKVLAVNDQVLRPIQPMSPSKLAEIAELPMDMVELSDGSTQLICMREDAADEHYCHHYNVGASVMLEINGGRDEHQFLHRENAIYQPFVGRLDMPEFIVSSMWAGTDFTEENGATRVVPGSHNWPEDRIAKLDEITRAVMPKGSVVLWLSRTLHGAAKSTVKVRRTGYAASYISDWVRQEENQYITVPPEIAKKYSERARQIIGYCSSDYVGWVKGREKNNLLETGHSGQI